jgi:hypothetical protein
VVLSRSATAIRTRRFTTQTHRLEFARLWARVADTPTSLRDSTDLGLPRSPKRGDVSARPGLSPVCWVLQRRPLDR